MWIYICVSQCLLEGEGIRKEFWILRWWVRMVTVNAHTWSHRKEQRVKLILIYFSFLSSFRSFAGCLSFLLLLLSFISFFFFLFVIFFYSSVLLSFFSWRIVYIFPFSFFLSLCVFLSFLLFFFSSFLFSSSSCFKFAIRAKFEMEWYHPYLPLMIFFSHVVEDSQIPFSLPERREKKNLTENASPGSNDVWCFTHLPVFR